MLDRILDRQPVVKYYVSEQNVLTVLDAVGEIIVSGHDFYELVLFPTTKLPDPTSTEQK